MNVESKRGLGTTVKREADEVLGQLNNADEPPELLAEGRPSCSTPNTEWLYSRGSNSESKNQPSSR